MARSRTFTSRAARANCPRDTIPDSTGCGAYRARGYDAVSAPTSASKRSFMRLLAQWARISPANASRSRPVLNPWRRTASSVATAPATRVMGSTAALVSTSQRDTGSRGRPLGGLVVRRTSTHAESRPWVGSAVGTVASLGWGATSLTWAWYRAARGGDESGRRPCAAAPAGKESGTAPSVIPPRSRGGTPHGTRHIAGQGPGRAHGRGHGSLERDRPGHRRGPRGSRRARGARRPHPRRHGRLDHAHQSRGGDGGGTRPRRARRRTGARAGGRGGVLHGTARRHG